MVRALISTREEISQKLHALVEELISFPTYEERLVRLQQEEGVAPWFSAHGELRSVIEAFSAEEALIFAELIILLQLEIATIEQVIGWIESLKGAERFYFERGGILG